ncbi:hypothetical protein LIER_37974 [Lithospermum erythrorhizon]|uniref:Uncharacterized protein n=1 Tax=Lithospermum erythrorhizon TaxID=34254 RepID=A0AAV3PWU4_LITER
MAEAEVERLAKLLTDLRFQRLATTPLSWNTAGAILTEFVLNFPSLRSLLEDYKQRFPKGLLGVVPPFLFPTPSRPLDGPE